jgi:hypothetical protein
VNSNVIFNPFVCIATIDGCTAFSDKQQKSPQEYTEVLVFNKGRWKATPDYIFE